MPKAAKDASAAPGTVGPRYFGMKSEPDDYSFDDLVKDKETDWDGVRNAQARNIMKSMAVGDVILYYHSVTEKAFVGIAKVTRAPYPDRTDATKKWVAVDITAVKKLSRPVTLAACKSNDKLQQIAPVRQGRLSVFPLEKKAAETILQLGGTKL